MDNARIQALKKAIKEILRGDDEEVDKFWHEPHPFLGFKTPSELSETEEGFRKLEILVNISLVENT